MIPAVGKSGAGTCSISSSTRASRGCRASARQRGDDLGQVVRRNVGRHPDRDARRAVDRADSGSAPAGPWAPAPCRRSSATKSTVSLSMSASISAAIFCQPAFGVSIRRGGVAVDRAEVALAVDQRIAQRKVLHHPHQRLVGRACRRAGDTCRARRRPRGRTST